MTDISAPSQQAVASPVPTGIHPLAEIFPLIEGEEFHALVEDIRTNGLINAAITHDDMVLDGRNRLRACEIAGVTPRYVVYEGDDPLGFVISQNIARRHLNQAQRAMIGARLTRLRDVETGQVSRLTHAEAAKIVHLNERAIRAAVRIIENGSAVLTTAIDQGRVALACANDIISLKLDEEDERFILGGNESLETIASNVERLKKEAKREETLKRIKADAAAAPEWPQGRYSVIYADPAWEDDFGMSTRGVENHYPVMSLDEIKSMPVAEIATPDAVLYLWATPHMFLKAAEVMARWGFEYRTNITWGKDSIGLGQWARNQTEHLLVGRRGSFPTPPESTRSPSLILAPRGEHSEKPDVFAEMIESWYPDAAKLELFRRGPARAGWAAWGNQALPAEAAE